MRKIALISEHASPLASVGSTDCGGQNIYVAHLARQLGSRGYQVDVFTRRDKALLPEVVAFAPNVRVIHVTAGPPVQIPKEQLLPYMEDFGTFLTEFLRRDAAGYDVLHANFFMSGLAALRAHHTLGIPLVMTFHALGKVRRLHQGSTDGFPDDRFGIEDTLVREADCVVAECPQDLDDLVNLYSADPTRVQTVPCGFDAAEFAPVARDAARRALGWPLQGFRVLQLGRLVPRKGIDNVIRALGCLRRDTGLDATLYVVGGNAEQPSVQATPEIGRLRDVASAEGVAERVVFTGRRGRDTLRLFYSAADVFVTTPWYEPFGITPVEAMACGAPVIGADVGGIRSTVVDGHTGFLVPPKAPAALAARLAELAADPALARKLGEAGRRRAQAHFTWAGVARQMEAVYARVCTGAPALQAGARRAAA
ncbi:glycosyltransferase [Cupriavidus taiwanensis]|uniref:glycosyltransferase n=1 Tax=Cupriavidus taiwanensis TaxID=164546 RepID=UPI000E10929A|nr:glycosyltransferase [Cupriavidus taiwanensis]SOY55498.1 putative Glycosyl transferase, group 1 [Cupriavidus taiwanensis]SOY55667.1 putative Glycosyl transferase, group 1 [Cupriavidus taiwanensis]SOY90511.1 putative Glycosyl transferase, group 1 [Cupriavidus taiwanensis]SOZ61772.1 putative Glycosyl transferase, group 1 [Cupriavidus taiwanensis]SOZ81839.1 putative Glycosyl transferase, group 1 [Cupriavidus taiwanensis]